MLDKLMQLKNHNLVKKPWGEYQVLEKTPGYWLKKIFIKKGEQSSLQSHKNRDEVWVVLQGKVKAQKGDASFILNEGEVLRELIKKKTSNIWPHQCLYLRSSFWSTQRKRHYSL